MNVVITESAFLSLQDIESYKTASLQSSQEAAAFTDALFDAAIEALQHNPERFKMCLELTSYGLQYRERITDDGYRTLFRIAGDNVYIMAFLHQRQSVQEALYRLMILR